MQYSGMYMPEVNPRPSMRRKTSSSNLLNLRPTPTSYNSSSQLLSAQTPTLASLPFGRDWDAQSLYSGDGHSLPTSNLVTNSVAGTSVDVLRDIVHKRMQTLTYLRSIHMGKTHWINTILPTKQELEKVFNNAAMRKRTHRFAVLGMSLANTFDVQPSQEFLRAIITTLADFDQFQDGNDKSSRIRFFRAGKAPRKGGGNDYAINLQEAGDTSYLVVPHMPFPLDYHQTLLSLVDILSEVYHKISRILGPSTFTSSLQMGPLGLITPYPGISYIFADDNTREMDASLLGIAYTGGTGSGFGGAPGSPPMWNPAWAEMVNKIDGKFKKIITMLTKELDTFARNAIKDELASLDPLLRNVVATDSTREQFDFEGTV